MRPKPDELWQDNRGRTRRVKSVDCEGNVIYETGDGKKGFASRDGWITAVVNGLRRAKQENIHA